MSKIIRDVAVVRTPRVIQMESMFDVPPSQKSALEWDVDLPLDERDWSIGLIVGPSGSGKSTVARELFAADLVEGFHWDPDKSVLDGFPEGMPVSEVVKICGSVGFNSPPSWLRPFRVLSNGEQFRVTMARAIAETSGLMVVDEFTSVVDRKVARVASHSVAKAVRAKGIRFVAVSCHSDIIEWLQPDWTFQPGAGKFRWRRLRRRPGLDLSIHPVDKAEWRHFKHHHYMSGNLSSAARCVGAFLPSGDCIAFAAWLRFPHPRVRNIVHGHRLVVLPDYQGLGIGGRLDDWIGQYLHERGYRYRNVVAHPAMRAYYTRSPRWVHLGTAQGNGKTTSKSVMNKRNVMGRLRVTSSFEYTAPAPAPAEP